MGEIERKHFREPKTYFWRTFAIMLVIIMCILITIDIAFFTTETELYEHTVSRKLIGSAGQRSGILFMKFLVEHFGKKGLIAMNMTVMFGAIYELYKEIAAYRRYKRKCRLFQEGLITNFYDIYDDYVPSFSIRRKLKRLFTGKGVIKKSYPSSREMKKRIKDSEKRYK